MHFQISSDFLLLLVLSKRHFFDFDSINYSKEYHAGTLPVNNPTFGSHRTASPRGARARRPGARVRRAGASGRCHVALPTGRGAGQHRAQSACRGTCRKRTADREARRRAHCLRSARPSRKHRRGPGPGDLEHPARGGIPVRCRRRAFSQQRISGRARRRLPRADMSETRLAGRQVSGTRCRHRAEGLQIPTKGAVSTDANTSRRRRTGGPRGDARRGPDAGVQKRRTTPHHRRPGAPALFLLCAQRAQHIRRQSSGARARAVRAHPCCTWCTNLSLSALHSD
jgi:hypothetical protein